MRLQKMHRAWNIFKNTGSIDSYLELVEVENIDQLNKILKAIRKVDSVYEVKRKK